MTKPNSEPSYRVTRREFLKAAATAVAVAPVLSNATHGQRIGVASVPEHRLWYRQPAANWNEALPIGSGRLAAMVFGGTALERIQINEDTIWAGEKRDRNNPEGAKNVAEVRRLLFAGKPKQAEELAEKTIIAIPKRMPPYQTLGDLVLKFAGHDAASEYVRDLDIDSAVSRVVYLADGVKYRREIFASAVDGVIAIRIVSDKPASLSFSATLTRQQN